MAVFQLRLHVQQLNDLKAVRQLGPERLQAVVVHLDQLDSPPLQPEVLIDEVATVLADRNESERLLTSILSLHGMMRQFAIPPKQVCESLGEALERDAEWDDDEIKEWRAVEPFVEKLLSTKGVRVVGRALDLAYEYSNLFRRARILTDIRPLYNDDATTIDGAIVSFTLRLRFDGSDGDHALSIAMDEVDVESMKAQCERALVKARTALALMNDKANVPSMITGETSDATH